MSVDELVESVDTRKIVLSSTPRWAFLNRSWSHRRPWSAGHYAEDKDYALIEIPLVYSSFEEAYDTAAETLGIEEFSVRHKSHIDKPRQTDEPLWTHFPVEDSGYSRAHCIQAAKQEGMLRASFWTESEYEVHEIEFWKFGDVVLSARAVLILVDV